MTFQEIRIIATGPCIANQLRDVNTICRRNWYIAAHTVKGDNINTQTINEILTIQLKEVLRNLESNDVAQQTLNNYCDSSTVEICHKCKRICRSTAVYLFESTLGSL